MKQNISLALIDNNEGQIKGLPANPRFIKDDKFVRLVKSVIDNPEMLDVRELLVVQFKKRFICFCGNMRLRVAKHIKNMPKSEFEEIVESKRDEGDFLEWYAAILLIGDNEQVPCKVFPADTNPKKLRAIAIKDNAQFGQDDYDLLANEWDMDELYDFGLDVPQFDDDEETEEPEPDKSISKKLIVECPSLDKLEELYLELQSRDFVCSLK